MDQVAQTFLAAIVGAFLVVLAALVLAWFLNRGAATREASLLQALQSERTARAEIEKARAVEREEADKYRAATDKRMAAMESELRAVKEELEVVKRRAEIERATLMNLLQIKQGKHPSPDGYEPDIPESEDTRFSAWIAKYFRMDGDIDLLAANAGFAQATPPPGSVDARANWLVTWARQQNLMGQLAATARKMRDKVPPW